MGFSIIAAVDKNYGIGKNGKIPWDLPSDMKYFNRITKGNGKNVVIMGRTTWESLPEKHRPLKDRYNIVLSRNRNHDSHTTHLKRAEGQKIDENIFIKDASFVADSFGSAFRVARMQNPEEIFVIGGAQIYRDTINHPECEKIYLTEIEGEFDCDAFFPKFDKKMFIERESSEQHIENGIRFCFKVYTKTA